MQHNIKSINHEFIFYNHNTHVLFLFKLLCVHLENVPCELQIHGKRIPSVENIQDIIVDTKIDSVHMTYAKEWCLIIGLEVTASIFL